MTPPPAASHAASGAVPIASRQLRRQLAAHSLGRLLDGQTWTRVRALVDVVVLYLASIACVLASSPVPVVAANRWFAALFPPLVLAILYSRRSPDERLNASLVDSTVQVLGVVSLAAMLMIALQSMVGAPHAVEVALRLWLFSAVYLGAARAVLLSVRRQIVQIPALATPTLVVGAGHVGEHVVTRLLAEPRYGMRPVGYLDSDPMPRPADAAALQVPVLGGVADLEGALAHTRAGHVILAFSSEPDQVLVEKVEQCRRLGVHVSLVPRLFETINERATLEHVGGMPLLALRPTDPRGWQFAVKHVFDRVVAGAALVLLAPLFAVMALLVRLSSPGPIFFRQQRVGRDGVEFTMLKFRTMRGDPAVDGEADASWAAEIKTDAGSGQSQPVDRTTKVGRVLRSTSLDELAQLINVVRGDMSLVGPRPERVAYVRAFERHVDRYSDRHRVKSGLTGWAQVNGFRGQTSIADRIEWDNYYIQSWSLWLDLKIIALTIAEVLRFRG